MTNQTENVTATQAAMRSLKEDRLNYQENRMHRLHIMFRQKYAPQDPRERNEFEADLAILLRQASIDATEHFREAAAAQIAKTHYAEIIRSK